MVAALMTLRPKIRSVVWRSTTAGEA